MKSSFLLLFLFLSQIGISQTTKTNYTNLKKLLAEGEKAYTENNFVLAKEIYTKVTDSVSWNHEYLYNLAAIELKLGETDNACEHFYKIYSLNDMKVVKYLAEYCPNFRGENLYSFEEVEEKPKFIYKDKEYPLIKNNNLNPVYISAINKAFNKSKILKEKASGRNFLSISINKHNEFTTGKIFKPASSKEDYDIVTTEIMFILKNTVTYIAAKNNGNNVDLWNKWDFLISVF
jgi:hypothetical protein